MLLDRYHVPKSLTKTSMLGRTLAAKGRRRSSMQRISGLFAGRKDLQPAPLEVYQMQTGTMI